MYSESRLMQKLVIIFSHLMFMWSLFSRPIFEHFLCRKTVFSDNVITYDLPMVCMQKLRLCYAIKPCSRKIIAQREPRIVTTVRDIFYEVHIKSFFIDDRSAFILEYTLALVYSCLQMVTSS
jgi:hypothetical protein